MMFLDGRPSCGARSVRSWLDDDGIARTQWWCLCGHSLTAPADVISYFVHEHLTAVIHLCPPDGSHVTPCCGRSPFDLLSGSHKLTVDPKLVTCGGASSWNHDGQYDGMPGD